MNTNTKIRKFLKSLDTDYNLDDDKPRKFKRGEYYRRWREIKESLIYKFNPKNINLYFLSDKKIFMEPIIFSSWLERNRREILKLFDISCNLEIQYGTGSLDIKTDYMDRKIRKQINLEYDTFIDNIIDYYFKTAKS